MLYKCDDDLGVNSRHPCNSQACLHMPVTPALGGTDRQITRIPGRPSSQAYMVSFRFSERLCVCVCLSMCLCPSVHVFVCTCVHETDRGQREYLYHLLLSSLFLFFEKAYLIESRLPWFGQTRWPLSSRALLVSTQTLLYSAGMRDVRCYILI